VAVSVGDEGPGKAEYPWITGERPLSQFRQLAIIAGRQVILNLAGLLLDEVIIVEQPFCSRNHTSAALELCGTRPIGSEQNRGMSLSRVCKDRTTGGLVVTRCAAARLSTCCSSRSTPKSSSRTGALSFHGAIESEAREHNEGSSS
jgi:hypothetical protein